MKIGTRFNFKDAIELGFEPYRVRVTGHSRPVLFLFFFFYQVWGTQNSESNKGATVQ